MLMRYFPSRTAPGRCLVLAHAGGSLNPLFERILFQTLAQVLEWAITKAQPFESHLRIGFCVYESNVRLIRATAIPG